MAPSYPSGCNVIKITNSNGLEYWAYPVRGGNIKQDKPAVSMSMPGGSPSDNQLMGLEGMERTFSLTFFIWDDGEDRANGTHTDTVVTIKEQIDYLLKYFQAPDFSVGWSVTEANSYYASRLPDMDVHLENINIPDLFGETNAKWIEADMDFIVGTTI